MRNFSFNNYVLSLPLEQRREIRRLEWAWIRSRRPLDRANGRSTDLVSAVAGDYAEQMRGYEDTPVGGRRRRRGLRPGFDF